MSAHTAISQVLNHPNFSNGMDDTVVDVVVIQWIMQKLMTDRLKRSAQSGGQRLVLDENN